MDLRVECYAGYRAEETPRRLRIGGRRVEVLEVLERWCSPEGRGFKLRGDDGVVYQLVRSEAGWRVASRGAG